MNLPDGGFECAYCGVVFYDDETCDCGGVPHDPDMLDDPEEFAIEELEGV